MKKNIKSNQELLQFGNIEGQNVNILGDVYHIYLAPEASRKINKHRKRKPFYKEAWYKSVSEILQKLISMAAIFDWFVHLIHLH